MKKLLLIVPAVFLLAAACNQQPAVQQNTQNTTPPAQTTPTPPPQNQTQQIDDTSNWKIYSYSQSGFSIKYPQNWEYTANYKGFNSCFRENGKNYPADDGSNLCAVGLTITNKADINLAKGILSNSDQINSMVQGYQVSKQQYTKTNMTVGGVSATIISGVGQDVFFEQGNYQYFLRVSDYKAANVGQGYEFSTAFAGVRDVLNKMLKTVQFTKSTSQNQTPDWKIYKNTQYGFQITLSDAFKGYSVTKNVDDYYASDYFTFSIPSTGLSPQVSIKVLTISTIPLNTWNSITKDPESTPPGTVLGKNTKFIFLAQLPQDGAGLPSSLLQRGAGSEMWAIMDSFKFIQ